MDQRRKENHEGFRTFMDLFVVTNSKARSKFKFNKKENNINNNNANGNINSSINSRY